MQRRQQRRHIVNDGGISAVDLFDGINWLKGAHLFGRGVHALIQFVVARLVQWQRGDQVGRDEDETDQISLNLVKALADEAPIEQSLGDGFALRMRLFALDLRPPEFADLAVKALELADLHAALRAADQELQRSTRRLIKPVPDRLSRYRVDHCRLQLAD